MLLGGTPACDDFHMKTRSIHKFQAMKLTSSFKKNKSSRSCCVLNFMIIFFSYLKVCSHEILGDRLYSRTATPRHAQRHSRAHSGRWAVKRGCSRLEARSEWLAHGLAPSHPHDHLCGWVQGSGFRVQGSGSRVQGFAPALPPVSVHRCLQGYLDHKKPPTIPGPP